MLGAFLKLMADKMLNVKRYFLKHKGLQKLVLSVFSIIVCLLILELFLRYIRYANFIKSWELPRHYFKSDSMAGYDLTENFPPEKWRCSDSEQLLWSNELGCFDYQYHGEDYILLLGDGFTWGSTPFETKYGTLLERLLNYRVVKCGLPGYGTKQELLKAKKIIEKIGKPPQLIILGYCAENDLSDDFLFPRVTVMDGLMLTAVVFNNISQQKEVIPDDRLREQVENYKRFGVTYKPSGIAERIKIWMRSHIYSYYLLGSIRRTVLNRLGFSSDKTADSTNIDIDIYEMSKFPWFRKVLEENLNTLREFKVLSDKCNAKLLVALIPPKYQVYDFLVDFKENNDKLDKFNATLTGFLSKENIGYLDLAPIFKDYANLTPRKRLDSRKDLYFRYDWRFSTKGNRLAALAIAKYILNNKLIIADKDAQSKAEELLLELKIEK